MVRKLVLLVSVLLVLSCSSGGTKKPIPGIDPNPDGIWGMGPDPFEAPVTVCHEKACVNVHKRGWPLCDFAPSLEVRCVNLDVIRYQIKRAVEACPSTKVYFPASLWLEPSLVRHCGAWAAGCTRGHDIYVPAYYTAWDGRVAHYASALKHELVAHIYRCSCDGHC